MTEQRGRVPGRGRTRAGGAATGGGGLTRPPGRSRAPTGPDWVLACVLLRVDATIARSASIAYGHCERLQWADQCRWQIAPGAQPAPAPSTWPGTERPPRPVG